MATTLPTGWSQAEFDEIYDRLVAEAEAASDDAIRKRSPPYLQVNVEEWLATGATVAPLPTAWSMAEFAEWMGGATVSADAFFRNYVLSRVPQPLQANAIEKLDTPPLTDVEQWVAAVVANGGTVSPARQTLVDTMIAAWKAAGTWVLIDDGWLLVAENAAQALTSIKQKRLAVAVNSPVFTIDRGYEFNGTTNYFATGFVPFNHAVAMTTSNVRLALYDRVNVTHNNYAAGCSTTNNRILRIRPRIVSGPAVIECNASGGSFTLPIADSRGLTSGSRNGPDTTTVVGYRNGVAMTRSADATAFGASLPAFEFYIGATNSGGTMATPRPCTLGWVVAGAALDAGQELAQYNALQSFMTSVGAQV